MPNLSTARISFKYPKLKIRNNNFCDGQGNEILQNFCSDPNQFGDNYTLYEPNGGIFGDRLTMFLVVWK